VIFGSSDDFYQLTLRMSRASRPSPQASRAVLGRDEPWQCRARSPKLPDGENRASNFITSQLGQIASEENWLPPKRRALISRSKPLLGGDCRDAVTLRLAIEDNLAVFPPRGLLLPPFTCSRKLSPAPWGLRRWARTNIHRRMIFLLPLSRRARDLGVRNARPILTSHQAHALSWPRDAGVGDATLLGKRRSIYRRSRQSHRATRW
jgi:hypothetical protein